MKKIIMIVLPFVLLTACVDTLDDWNIDQKRASSVPAPTLFTGALKNLTDALTTPNVNNNNYRLFVQYWTTTQYVDEPRYNMTARSYSQALWNSIYKDVLSDLKECRRLVDANEALAPAVKGNQLALISLIEVYAWSVLVNTFGDVPYTEALDPEIPTPVYDDAATIYSDLLNRLEGALTSLSPADGSFGTADLLYNGSIPKWVKFGNSMKLRMGMLLCDVSSSTAQSLVSSAFAGGVIELKADNARFPYISAPPNNNPISANLNTQFTSREDFVPAKVLVDSMNSYNDPRRPFYFTQVTEANLPVDFPVGAPRYIGGKYGLANQPYAAFSHISEKIIAPTFEALLIDNSEVLFLLAEAVERGYIGGDAELYYNRAITASIDYWGGSEADATAYLAQEKVAYTTALEDDPDYDATYKEKIAFQKWLAMNNRGWDSWVDWRRLDFPKLVPPNGTGVPDGLQIPVRMIFPVSEQTSNSSAWETAAARFNADSPNTKLFWDVN